MLQIVKFDKSPGQASARTKWTAERRSQFGWRCWSARLPVVFDQTWQALRS